MGRHKATPEYKAEMRERIIQAAIHQFAKYGFDQTKMEDIAKAAKLSKGLPYFYFPSKEDLFHAICDHDIELLKKQLGSMFSDKEAGAVFDAEKFYDYFQNVGADALAVSFEMISEAARNPKLRKTLVEYRKKTLQAVVQFLSSQVERGAIGKGINIDAVALGLTALYEGLMVNRLLKTDPDLNRQSWIETVKAILAGVS